MASSKWCSLTPSHCLKLYKGYFHFSVFFFFVFPSDCSKPSIARSSSPNSALNMPQSFGSPMGLSLTDSLPAAGLPPMMQNTSERSTPFVNEETGTPLPSSSDMDTCWPIRPTLRNELDTFSVHFYIFFGPNISIPPNRTAVFAINLMPVLDSGGVLNLELKLNVVSTQHC